MMIRTVLITGLTVLGVSAAHAQPSPAVPAPPPAPARPPGATTAPPEKIVPKGGAQDNGDTMSDRLSRQRGTVKPPPVDPGMAVTPPNNGASSTMPVIPPPGSPGGNPKVVPK